MKSNILISKKLGKILLEFLLFFPICFSEIIPRTLLFNDPKYSQVTISPDGHNVAFLAPNEFGISNVFTKCITCKYTTSVTFENRRHINGWFFLLIKCITSLILSLKQS